MQRNGFTLVELLIVVGIAAILYSLATMEFHRYSEKSAVEQQIRVMNDALTTARTQALFQKKEIAVNISATGFSVYSSTVTTVPPVVSQSLRYSVSTGGLPAPLIFTTRGTIDGVDTPAAICIDPSTNQGAFDTLLLSTTRIHTGKRNAGTACSSANIVIK